MTNTTDDTTTSKIEYTDALNIQFNIASDLYKHEDSLNWSKVNHFLYVTGGLGALMAFSLKNDLKTLTHVIDPIILIAIIGIVSSIGFAIAIFSGVEYMKVRKQVVVDLDNLLKNSTGHSIMQADHSDFNKNSPTMLVIKLFPIIIGVIWLVILLSRIFGA